MLGPRLPLQPILSEFIYLLTLNSLIVCLFIRRSQIPVLLKGIGFVILFDNPAECVHFRIFLYFAPFNSSLLSILDTPTLDTDQLVDIRTFHVVAIHILVLPHKYIYM